MLKAYKYQLFPTSTQEVLLNKHFGCARFIWNWALETKTKSYYLDKTKLSRFDLTNMIPDLKKQEEYKWLKEVVAQSLQAVMEDLDAAFTSFFNKKSNYPKFKSKKGNKHSYRIPQGTKINFENGTISIYKFTEGIDFDNHRQFEGKITRSTVSKTPTGKYFISILVNDGSELPYKPEIKEETTLGIDLGLTTYATLSTGEKIENPRWLRKKQKKLSRENRRLSRKLKGGKNREKQRIKVAKTYEKITNQRKDFQHKLSYKLTHDNQVDTIIMETLGVRDMMKNNKLAKSIQDASWYSFQEMMKYKCDWYGKNFIQIGRFEPSSKLCECGVINQELTLKDRLWTCSSCGLTHDRDVLAANNIKKIGLVQPESTSVERPVRVSKKQKITVDPLG